MAGDEIQEQARALGDPTRYRLYRYVADRDDAVGIAELTAHVGLHHNAVRQHVSALVHAGLLLETTEVRATRGRPRLLYRPEPRARQRWLTAGPYHRLSLLLLDLLASGDTPEVVGRRAADQGRVPTDGSPLDRFVDAVASEGFAPRARRVADHDELVLGHCPFAEAASSDPGTICELHLGLARGISDQIQGVDVVDLVPADPHRAGCRLRIRLEHGESRVDARSR